MNKLTLQERIKALLEYRRGEEAQDYQERVQKMVENSIVLITRLEQVKLLMSGSPSIAPMTDALILDRVTETLENLEAQIENLEKL